MFASSRNRSNPSTGLAKFTSAEERQHLEAQAVLDTKVAQAKALSAQIKVLSEQLSAVNSTVATTQAQLDESRYIQNATSENLEILLLAKTKATILTCSFDRLDNAILIDVPNQRDHSFLNTMLNPYLKKGEFTVKNGETNRYGQLSIRAVIGSDKVQALIAGLSLATDETLKINTSLAKC